MKMIGLIYLYLKLIQINGFCIYIFFFFIEEFVVYGSIVNCVVLSKKFGRVIVIGGEDRKVNLWIVGKLNCLMVNMMENFRIFKD